MKTTTDNLQSMLNAFYKASKHGDTLLADGKPGEKLNSIGNWTLSILKPESHSRLKSIAAVFVRPFVKKDVLRQVANLEDSKKNALESLAKAFQKNLSDGVGSFAEEVYDKAKLAFPTQKDVTLHNVKDLKTLIEKARQDHLANRALQVQSTLDGVYDDTLSQTPSSEVSAAIDAINEHYLGETFPENASPAVKHYLEGAQHFRDELRKLEASRPSDRDMALVAAIGKNSQHTHVMTREEYNDARFKLIEDFREYRDKILSVLEEVQPKSELKVVGATTKEKLSAYVKGAEAFYNKDVSPAALPLKGFGAFMQGYYNGPDGFRPSSRDRMMFNFILNAPLFDDVEDRMESADRRLAGIEEDMKEKSRAAEALKPKADDYPSFTFVDDVVEPEGFEPTTPLKTPMGEEEALTLKADDYAALKFIDEVDEPEGLGSTATLNTSNLEESVRVQELRVEYQKALKEKQTAVDLEVLRETLQRLAVLGS